MNVIEIKHLTKNYGKNRGICDVSFNVMEGEIVGFIGPNGAGKTTTIRTLLGLIHPTSGSADIFGMDCIKQAPQIAKRVGYLPGENSYYDQLSVKELLNYSAALYGIDCKERMNELVDRLQLDVNRKISQLSLGNRKKVGIVSALMHTPKLLILDEPTSGLDPLIQQTLFEILAEEKQKGVTILFSSHVLSEVQKICDRVVIIKEGSILTTQTMSELQNNGYKRVKLLLKSKADKRMFAAFSDVCIQDQQVSFMYQGDCSQLIQKLAHLDIQDITINEPTLEEIFLHYYQ